MIKITRFFYLLLCICLLSCTKKQDNANTYLEKTITENGYTYTTVEGDPLKARIYTLANGLKVYLSVYKDEPRIQTYIAVRAGSKNDPAAATGLAHYLEHILFKGNSKIGSLDWQKEKPLLDSIEYLYQTYRKTKDAAQRKAIYGQIDKLSNRAAQFAVANEYDKLMANIGAKGTNAYTWFEQTVYVNDIPANQMAKWAEIESERFGELVPRLFHTELEAVYEEKNISLDSDADKVQETMFAALFPKHQYGTQTTIGTVEHLKNPSITEIKRYFDTYYVPNNMAICLSGDLDPAATIKIIDQHFGKLKPKPIPTFTPATESPVVHTVKEVVGPEVENVNIGFRFAGVGTQEARLMQLTDMVLANSQAGLIDLNLNQKQKVLNAFSYQMVLKDYAVHLLGGTPRQGQSLEDVKKLVLAQIDSIKQGRFDVWLLQAIINDMKTSQMKSYETNQGRASAMVEAFILGQNWKTYTAQIDSMALVTKNDLVAFAQKHYNNNYVTIYKRTGIDKQVQKVVKPAITPVALNREKQSAFFHKLTQTPAPKIKPVFLDFNKDLQKLQWHDSIPIIYKRNDENGLFELYYLFDMGTNTDPKLALALNYLKYLGTPKLQADALQKEFYKLGCNFNVMASNDRMYITLSGLDENFAPALQLLEDLLGNPQPDTAALSDMVNGILKERADAKLDKDLILRKAMVSYAKYGKLSPFTNILNTAQLHELKPQDLIARIKGITAYKHRVLYYGPKKDKDLLHTLQQYHHVPDQPKALPTARPFPEQAIRQNQVYWVNYDMVQAEVMFLSRSVLFNQEILPQITLYNEYFGGGMGSVVFQELRESKALAYSAYSSYAQAQDKDKANYIQSYIGTQADKLADALGGMQGLLRAMPQDAGSFSTAREAVLSKLETGRITKSGVLFEYEKARRLGLNEDVRKAVYEKIQYMDFQAIKQFQQQYISKQPYILLVLGSKDKLDFKTLRQYGPVKQLSLEEVFGY